MKKRIIWIVCLAIVVLILAFLFLPRLLGKKVFGDLTAGDLKRVTVQVPPSSEEKAVQDLEPFIDFLNKVEVYGREDFPEKGDDREVIYRITFAEGYQIVVGVTDSYVNVDGVGYKAKASACGKLLQLADELVK